MEYQPAYILTLRMDENAQAFFDQLRQRYFPAERNFLSAHLTIFHKLPVGDEVTNVLDSIRISPLQLTVSGLRNLGNGVAYQLQSEALNVLRDKLQSLFDFKLSAQDSQGFRAHVTVQNKVSAVDAKNLLLKLNESFVPFTVTGLGLDLWLYLGGPWEHVKYYPFIV